MPTTYRYYQKYQLLNLIRHFAPISRKKLVELMDLRPASVGDLTKELLEEGLIVETGLSSGGHGRRRILLDINKRDLCALVLSFSERLVNYTVVQFDGETVLKTEQPLPTGGDDARLTGIAAQIETLLRRTADRRIVGIGLCDPIYNDPRPASALSYDSFLLWLHDTLCPALEKRFSLPVSSFSTVCLPALAEHRFGCGVGCEHLLCVELSNGLGLSAYADGRAITGAHGMAGELGHTVTDARRDAAPCYCGKTGCVEQTAAFPYLQASLQKAIESGTATVLAGKKNLTVSDIRAALEQHDRLCMRCVRQIAENAGLAIANAVTLFDPERVVLYGFLLELGDYYLTILKNTILENVMSAELTICVSDATEGLLPLGAAAELFSAFLRVEENRWIYKLPNTEAEEDGQ